MDSEEIDETLEYREDHKYGALVEYDLENSQRFHDSNNDYPLASENVEIDGVRKLVPSQSKRENIPFIFRTSNTISHRK